MSDAPERIWAWDDTSVTCEERGYREGEWTTEPCGEMTSAFLFIRADLDAAKDARIADLEKQLSEARDAALEEAALLARRLGNDAEKEADKRSVTQGQKTGLHLVRDAAFALETAIRSLKGAAK